MTDTKICPFCAEEIKEAAIRCRYCQSDLTTTPAADVPVGPAEREPSPVVESRARRPPRPHMPRMLARGSGSVRTRPPPLRWLVLLAVLSLLSATAVGFFVRDLNRMTDTEEARTSGQATAAEYVEKILSYHHKRLDQDVAQASKLMTSGFEEEYTQTIDQVRELATNESAVVKAEVVASSVVEADPDRVEALLFVNQTTTGDQVEEPRVDLNRVLVTLTRDGDQGWLVSQLDAL